VNAFLKLERLNKREKYVLYGALGGFGLWIIIQLVVFPVFGKRDRMEKNLQAKINMLAEMQQLSSDYQALTQNAQIAAARFGRREKGFTLFSFLDQLAGEAGIKNRISYMKPSKTEQKNGSYKISRVEMKLDEITLEQLVKYLYGVETSENLVEIKKLSITKKDTKQSLISVVMQVETVEI
jgi:general secretion pathway protein M